MELSTPLSYDPDRMGQFKLCLYLPPYNEYRVKVANFPGANANKAWGMDGKFFTSSDVYVEGKKVARMHTECVDESGYVSVDLTEVASLIDPDQSALVIVGMCHDLKIPAETYASYYHCQTGSYISFPVAGFIGDQIYTESHADRLENTMFWPGIVSNEHSESCIIVTNPFDVNFSYQLTLFAPDGSKQQSEVLRLKRHQFKIHSIEEVFAEFLQQCDYPSDVCSLCVSAQYKVISYFGIRDRQNKFFTTLDHLHPFILV